MGCDGERRLIFGGVCCRCGAIQIHEGMWVRLPGVVGVLKSFAVQVEGGVLEYEVSHGYCPTCQLEVILRWHKERRATVGVAVERRHPGESGDVICEGGLVERWRCI